MSEQRQNAINELVEKLGIDFDTLESYFIFLDDLRRSGITNMFGAAPYLQEFDGNLTKDEARKVLSSWMNSYGGE